MRRQWQRQFASDHDFPTTPINTKYAICTTSRSGSHLLGHLLYATSAMGYPLEYLHPDHAERWAERAGGRPVLDFVKERRTSPNGCFGIKLMYSHLPRLLSQENPRYEILNYRFIHLVREDLVAQAVSQVRATQTGSWISEMEELAEPVYDWSLIRAQVDRIAHQNSAWDAFFEGLGLDRLTLRYEDVVENPVAAVKAIADHVEIDLPPEPGDGFVPAAQSSGRDNWKQRFIDESRTRVAAGSDVAGVPSLPAPSARSIIAKRLPLPVRRAIRRLVPR